MKTFYFEMEDGTSVPIQAKSEAEAYEKAQAHQESIWRGEAEPGWDAGRIASLTGRAALEGLTEGVGSIASFPADMVYNATAALWKGGDYLAGTDTAPDFGLPLTGMVAHGADALSDSIGLAEPETDNEKLMMSIGKGAISALPGLGVGAGLAGARGIVGTAGRFLAGSPKTQILSGAAGGGASEYTMQQTADPRLALLAGIAGGGAAGAATGAVSGGRIVTRSLRRGGRDEIIGDALNASATNPRRALYNLDNTQQIVPGSQPLTGVASADPGLINLQRGVERADPLKRFAQNTEEANNAYHRVLRANSMTQAEADAASAARTAQADIDTAALFDTPAMRDARMPVGQLMADLHAFRQDRRNYARQPVKEAVRYARNQIVQNSRRNPRTGVMEINPGVLYSIRQNLAEAMRGAVQLTDAPALKLAGRTGGNILDVIDNHIETSAPGFGAYMQDLARSGEARSQGIAAGEIYRASTSKGPGGITIDEPFLNLATLRKNLDARHRELSPQQNTAFDMVVRDLDRRSKVNSPSVRAAGSDTVQNLAIDSNMTRLFGGGIANSWPGEMLGNFLSKLPIVGSRVGENATKDRMVDAMLDPRLASALMKDANARNLGAPNSVVAKPVAGLLGGTRAAAPQMWVVEDANGNRYDSNGKLVGKVD